MASYNIITEVLCRDMEKAVRSRSAEPPAKITGDSQIGFPEQPPAVSPLPPLHWDSHTGTVPLPCWHQLLPGVLPHTSPLGALPAQSQS